MAGESNTLPPIQIRDVWNYNLQEEIDVISNELVDNYPYIAMDTEFPGKVVRAFMDTKDRELIEYTSLKMNLELLPLIQMGITLTDENGDLPICESDGHIIRPVWQFNFRGFNEERDPHAEDSIALLKHAGINFQKNESYGVDVRHFGELLQTSGMVLNEDVRWVTFHGGYDFAFLLSQALTDKPLPQTATEFYNLLNTFFPKVYDIRYVTRYCNGVFGGLEEMAKMLGVERTAGLAHQAGSDSLLTAALYKKVKDVCFQGSSPSHRAGVLYLS